MLSPRRSSVNLNYFVVEEGREGLLKGKESKSGGSKCSWLRALWLIYDSLVREKCEMDDAWGQLALPEPHHTSRTFKMHLAHPTIRLDPWCDWGAAEAG